MGGVRLGRAWVAVVLAAVGATVAAQLLGRGAWRPLVALAAGAAAGLLCGLPLYLSVRRRLHGLSRATRALAQGDFDAALPPPVEDELGDLQRAWKRMRLTMEERIEDLRGEADRQRSILDGMAEGVALLDHGEIVAANPAFGRLVGARGPVVGKTPLEVARLPELAEVIEESVRADAEVVRELVAEPHALRVAVRPLRGRQRRTVVVLLDMTEARRVERLRRDFVANASHELRTPVAAILGAAETLAGGAADDAAARASFVDIVLRHAHRLSRLTGDLLDLGRLEAGYRPRAEIVAVDAVFEAVLLSLAPRAAQKGVALAARIEPAGEAAPRIAAERAAVEQILSNLIDNAVKYTPPHGAITVTARTDGPRVALEVADTGPGIAADQLPRLFERFYRVDDARAREQGGTGLGLAIVKHLVAASGGEILVDSRVGAGTRFTVLLPRPDPDAKMSHGGHDA